MGAGLWAIGCSLLALLWALTFGRDCLDPVLLLKTYPYAQDPDD